jgi:hypothetical protein
MGNILLQTGHSLRICYVQEVKDTDKFSPEEQEHLSYLGSMLRREPTQEEEEADKMFELILKHGVMVNGKIVKQGN